MLSEWNKGPYEKDLAPSTGQPLMLPSLPVAPPWHGGPAHPALLRPALSLLQSIKFSTKLRASAEQEKRTLPARDHLTAVPSAPTPSPCQLEASHRQESTAVRCLQHTVPHVSRGAKNFQTPRLPSRVHNLSPSMHASHPSSPDYLATHPRLPGLGSAGIGPSWTEAAKAVQALMAQWGSSRNSPGQLGTQKQQPQNCGSLIIPQVQVPMQIARQAHAHACT